MPHLLTLHQVAARPHLLRWHLELPSGRSYVLRPIEATDEPQLCDFVTQLSEPTRRFYSIHQAPATTAAEWCAAIARYDKLRFLVADPRHVVAVVEFSFDLPPGDVERFRTHGYPLNALSDCRFGLCVIDALQGQGLAPALLQPVREIARRFGRARIILWGGVMTENARARRYYSRAGFEAVGEFVNSVGVASVDMVLKT